MRRIPELDALRGIAALVIVMAHVGFLPGTGWVLSAVDLFFVLSGYLITENILKNRYAAGFLPVFLARRSLRIWPAYYLAFGVCLILNRRLKWDAAPDAWLNYLTYTQNVQAYLGRPIPGFSGMFLHTWTLAIEEQFYLLWPLLLWRAPRRSMPLIALTLVAAPALLRSLGYPSFLLLTRCDGLALGGLLALLLDRPEGDARHARADPRGFAAIGLAALVGPWLAEMALRSLHVTQGFHDGLFTSRACLVYFGLCGTVLCLGGDPRLKFLRDPRLCYVGTVSYGLYLYHPLVFGALPGLYKRLVFRRLGLTSTLLMDLVMLAVCFALAEASRRWVEAPILALKERLRYGSPRNPQKYPGLHLGMLGSRVGSREAA